MNGFLSAVSEMIERSENRMKAFIQGGIQKQVDLLTESVASLIQRRDAALEQIAYLAEKTVSLEVKQDVMCNKLNAMEKKMDAHGEQNRSIGAGRF